MSPIQELVFFTTLGLVALTALVFLIVLGTAVWWTVRDRRETRARARELAAEPALTEAVRLAVVQPQARIYDFTHRGGAA